MHTCPLCSSDNSGFYHQDKRRSYYQCQRCHLVFVDPQQLPSADDELHEYRLHQNAATDPGYRRFLSRLANPLLSALNTPVEGLDFGCGPTPLLASILEEHGHSMQIYDPYFFPNASVLERSYQLITCTEAIEHFHHPQREWSLWMSMLAPGGMLAIMTKRVISAERFATWHYKNDPTHVSFFSEATFSWLAAQFRLELILVGQDVVFFSNPMSLPQQSDVK